MRPSAAARDSCTVCMIWMPATTPDLRGELLRRTRDAEVGLVDDVRDRGRHRGRRRAEPDARQHQSEDDVRVGRALPHRGERHHRGRHEERAGDPHPPDAEPSAEVARGGTGQREGERPEDREQPDLRRPVAEAVREQQRREDEAAHVREVGEELHRDRRGEVPLLEVGEREAADQTPGARTR